MERVKPPQLSLTAPQSSLVKSATASVRKALDERMMLSEAVQQVSNLLRAYPNGGANAADGYIGVLASILLQYPRSVSLRCCDPTTGVARETRFLPTVADLVAWCEAETADMRRPVDREDRQDRILREMAEDRARVEGTAAARPKRLTTDELKARYGDDWGLVVAAQDERAMAAKRAHTQRANDLLFQRECAAAGVDPSLRVSPTLAKKIAEHLAEAAE